jgi:hypothetical protein
MPKPSTGELFLDESIPHASASPQLDMGAANRSAAPEHFLCQSSGISKRCPIGRLQLGKEARCTAQSL